MSGHDQGSPKRLLPANAYRKLEGDESYAPIVPSDSPMAEVTVWSVLMGLIMVVIFSAACVYIALRAGSGIEAAIPIAVAAIFFGRARKIKSSILENVIVQSIGQASGVVAAGSAFVIPALYLNQIEPAWWQIFLACFFGGALGVVLIIPLRRYFVSDRHGELPFPEATATTEILVAGESTGGGAGKVLLASFGLGAAYDFLVEVVHGWNPALTTKTLLGGAGDWLYNMRLEIRMHAIAALFGLGYIIGLKYAAIIMAGSVFAYLIMGPALYYIGMSWGTFSYAGNDYDLSTMFAGDIFSAFIKPIAIGAIATAGVIGLIKMGKIIVSSVSLGFKGIGKKAVAGHADRLDLDMKASHVLLIELLTTLLMGLLFFIVCMGTDDYSVTQSLTYSLVGMVVAFLLIFLFTPVAAEAIAIVGVNPVSGMTLVTVVLASLVMAGIGLYGKTGIFVALIIGTAVCTALSVSGALISDFKIGYWIGATPKKQQGWKFLGLIVASLVVAFVIPIMDQGYHFLVPGADGQLISNEVVLPAPQANMIATVVQGLMTDGQTPFMLYGIGALIAIVITFLGVPTLAFALGMYLPIAINSAVLVGGFVSWLVARSGKDAKERESRKGQGILIASGMMAGAAIMGIVSAALRLDWTSYAVRFLSIGEKFVVNTTPEGVTSLAGTPAHWYEGFPGQGLSLLMFGGLVLATFLLAKWGAKMELSGDE